MCHNNFGVASHIEESTLNEIHRPTPDKVRNPPRMMGLDGARADRVEEDSGRRRESRCASSSARTNKGMSHRGDGTNYCTIVSQRILDLLNLDLTINFGKHKLA